MPAKEPKVDYLDEDPEIPSQRYVLLSFISPENVLKNKEQYFFKNFLKYYEVQWRTKKLEEHIAGQINELNKKLEDISDKFEAANQPDVADICRKNRITIDDFILNFQAFVKKNTKDIQDTDIENSYKDFLFTHEAALEKEFHAANEFKTTVRGLKVRGSFGTIDEAKARAKKLQKVDDVHNIALGEVGKWLPWDPSGDQFSSQEYAEDQLNDLMQKYRENEDNKNELFRQAKLSKPTPAIGDSGVVDDNGLFGAKDEAGAAVSDAAAAENTFEPMFSGEDLALARKKERSAESDSA
jgi:hypothetical protein